MRTPFRINPVEVKIKLVSRKNRFDDESKIPFVMLDEDFRQPKGTKFYGNADTEQEYITTYSQVVYKKTETLSKYEIGNVPESDGHLCFRKSDYDSLDYPLAVGDRIIEISGKSVNYSIIEIQPSGHLRKKANLMLVYFMNENRQLSGGVKR